MKTIFVKNKFFTRAISALALILVSGVIFACKNDAEGESSPSGVPNGKTVKAITATAPSKNQYSGDEIFQSAGIVVKAIYEDDSQEVLSQDKYTITPPDFDRNASGTNTYDVVITLKANAAIKTMVSVTYSKAELTLSSIEVVTKPSKLTYYEGDAFDKSGMVVKATYSDGSSNPITPQSVTVEGENDGVLSQTGTKTVTVSHNGKTATFSITVNAVEIVSISATNPTKTSYTGNEEFSPAGIVVTAHKNNGSEEILSSDKYEITNPAFVRTQAGVTPYDVTITLKEKSSITTKVTVTYSKAAAVLKSISVKQNPSQTTYFVGDTFDSTGLEVEAVYTENGVDQDPVPVTADVSNPDMTTSGNKTVTVTFGGKTASFNITVEAIRLVSISLNTDGVKKAFYTGDMFNSAGLVVNAVYNDARKNKTVNPTSVTAEGLTDGKFSETGSKKVTVTYTEGAVSETDEYSVNVTLLVLESIAIKTNPSKTTYKVGQSLDKTGLVVTASFNNGTTREIGAGDLTCDVTSFTEVAESKTVTVTYTFAGVSKTATFTVKVEEGGVDWDWKADDLATGDINDSLISGNVTVIPGGSKLTVVEKTASFNGVSYSKYIKTNGSGNIGKRALKFSVVANCTIKVVCYVSSGDNKTVTIAKSASENLGVNAVLTSVSELEFANTKGAGDLYLYTSDNVYIYAIYVEYGTPAVKPTGISLNYTTLTSDLAESTDNKTESLVATLAPSGITEGWDEITWTTSDSSVASISPATGKTVKVTYGAKKGNATITAKTKNNLTATCSVTVRDSSAPVSGNVIKASDMPLGFAGMNYTMPSFSSSNTVTVTTRNALMEAIKNGNKLIYISGMIDMSDEGSGSKLPLKNTNNIAVPEEMDRWLSEKSGGNYTYYSKYKADGSEGGLLDSARGNTEEKLKKVWVNAYAGACKENTEDGKSSSYNSTLYSTMKTLNGEWQKVIQLNLQSNTTIIGLGTNSGLRGGTLVIDGKQNIVIRNLYLLDAIDMFPHHEQKNSTTSDGFNSQFDCITIQGSNTANIWIDHCTFEDTLIMQHVDNGTKEKWQNYDGSCDIKGDAKGVTVSNCHFFKHDKTMLIGSDDSEGSNETRKVSLINNYFDSCVQRLPMVRNSQIHILNNYYDFNSNYTVGDGKTKMSYGIGVRSGSRVYSQGNYFASNINAAYANENLSSSNKGAGWYFIDGDGGEGQSKTYFKQSSSAILKSSLSELGWAPPYDYTPMTAEEAKTYAKANSGHGVWSVEQ